MRFSAPGQKILKAIDREHFSAESISNMLISDYGFKKIGSGSYTTTYGKPRVPYVIKVNKDSDPAAYKFFSMIMNKDSKYFPKIFKLKTYVSKNGEFLFVAIVERLFPFNTFTWKRLNEDGKGFISWLSLHPDSCIKLPYEKDKENVGKYWNKNNVYDAKFVKSIFKTTEQFAQLDLFNQNVMVRLPDGDIVLNDPLCLSC
jgi:hypothetical protein